MRAIVYINLNIYSIVFFITLVELIIFYIFRISFMVALFLATDYFYFYCYLLTSCLHYFIWFELILLLLLLVIYYTGLYPLLFTFYFLEPLIPPQ